MLNYFALPYGTQSFSALRDGEQIYVDKTAMIYELARGRNKVFLARPRRFGKSLLVSTFASLLAHGLRDFQGLAIEKLWKDKTYHVIQLDFSNISNFDTPDRFESRFRSMLAVRFAPLGFEPSGDADRFMEEFSAWLSLQANASLVLLIDEYDAPLTQVLHDKTLFDGVQKVLREFFNILKTNEGCFRFLFLTGITRFSHTSIFSGFNNLYDISLSPEFGTLLGYTESEIETYFSEYIEAKAQTLKISRQELIAQLREYYDGFSFDSDGSTHVYCPWSILSFFGSRQSKFENYWFASGGQPSVLMNYLTQRKLEKPLNFLETVCMDPTKLLSSSPYELMDADLLLLQTGYLTIRSVDEGGGLHLGYPNREVASSMALLYAKVLMKDSEFSPQPLLTHLLRGQTEHVVAFFNSVFNALDYDRYPIRDEASFKGALQILLIGISLNPQIEVHSARGRSDLEVEADAYHWVFELKFSKTGVDTTTLCDKAAVQISDKNYGLTPHGKKLKRVALVFDDVQRQITNWKEV